MDAVKRQLTGRSPDYVRGYLGALKAVGKLTDQDVGSLLAWATETAIRRIVSGPLGEPEGSAG